MNTETLASANLAPEESGNLRQGIQVIERAAAILRALQNHADGLSLGELAKRVDLPRSTVQRIVDALDREGLVRAAAPGRGVRLGPALLTLAAAARFHLAELARATLESLARATQETVDLSIIDHDRAVFIDQIAGSHRLTAISAVGVAFPLHATANGKALLASLSEAELTALRPRLRLDTYTANTLTTQQALDTEIARIRAAGIAYDREEHAEGISAVGAAVRCQGGELLAISIPVPTQRFLRNEEQLTRVLREHVAQLVRINQNSG